MWPPHGLSYYERGNRAMHGEVAPYNWIRIVGRCTPSPKKFYGFLVNIYSLVFKYILVRFYKCKINISVYFYMADQATPFYLKGFFKCREKIIFHVSIP